MDYQTPVIFVGLFSLASLVLVFIYKFGIKEKSYEEALAEQRLQTQIFLTKTKPKEKKSKKSSKKTKQKAATEESSENNGASSSDAVHEEPPESIKLSPKKGHVEFKEVAEDVIPKPTNILKKQTKKEKVKPILVQKNKPEPSIPKEVEPLPLNNFESTHPKDEVKLHTNSASGKNVAETAPENVVQAKVEVKTIEIPVQNSIQKEKTGLVSNGVIGNAGKEKKKKKSEFNTLQQLDTNGPNLSALLNLVRKAEMSRSDVQILIDLLLNKQHDTPAVLDEWSEGKSDPVQKLKKQLAEKERLYLDEKELSASAQNKLREIRAEIQTEKSQLNQKMRGYDEILQAKQLELNHLQQSQLQVQNQFKDEMMKNHQLREELTAMQMQRQQMEIRLAQSQGSDVIIDNLQRELQELARLKKELSIQLARKNDEADRCQSRSLQLQNELEQVMIERNHVTEDMRKSLLKQEGEYKMEIARLNNTIKDEMRRLEHEKKQTMDQNQELSKLVNQLQEEKTHLQNVHINGSLQESKQHQTEILNLHNQLASLQAQLGEKQNEHESELNATNAIIDTLKSELEAEKAKVEEQKQRNNDLRTKNWKVMDALNSAENKLKSSKKASNEQAQKEFLQRLFPEISELAGVSDENVEKEGEKLIRNFVNRLKDEQSRSSVEEDNSVEVRQLTSQLQHYKKVIDDTDNVLNNLQKHIEEEELKWRVQLSEKNNEIDALKDKLASNEINTKLAKVS